MKSMIIHGAFAGEQIAAGYGNARPPLHAPIVERAVSYLGISKPVDLALDIGCGAGLSTRAIDQLARRCIGLDPAETMIRQARIGPITADFLVGRAEPLPVRSQSVALMTAAGSLNYAELGPFYDEAQRVLVPQGTLLVYDFFAGRRTKFSNQLDQWFSEMLTRWPTSDSSGREIDADLLAQGPLEIGAHESFTIDVEFELNGYIDYVMTERNMAEALRSGTPRTEIRTWCEETLGSLFATSVFVEFDAYFVCLATA